jgi:hypothetical protein
MFSYCYSNQTNNFAVIIISIIIFAHFENKVIVIAAFKNLQLSSQF